jgi:hypothetical protein
MDVAKRRLLDEAYDAVIQIGWHDKSLDELGRYFTPDFMIYGTGSKNSGRKSANRPMSSYLQSMGCTPWHNWKRMMI